MRVVVLWLLCGYVQGILAEDVGYLGPPKGFSYQHEVYPPAAPPPCPDGFRPDDFGGCIDDDECRKDPLIVCGLHADCYNTYGSYKCQCSSGFKKDHYDKCVDANECEDKTALCTENENCFNLIGKYSCICKVGFIPTEYGCLKIGLKYPEPRPKYPPNSYPPHDDYPSNDDYPPKDGYPPNSHSPGGYSPPTIADPYPPYLYPPPTTTKKIASYNTYQSTPYKLHLGYTTTEKPDSYGQYTPRPPTKKPDKYK